MRVPTVVRLLPLILAPTSLASAAAGADLRTAPLAPESFHLKADELPKPYATDSAKKNPQVDAVPADEIAAHSGAVHAAREAPMAVLAELASHAAAGTQKLHAEKPAGDASVTA